MLRDMDLTRFGRGILALRQRRGWRQEDLAAAAGVARSVAGRVERGLTHGVTVDALAAVAEAVGARVSIRLVWQGEDLDRLLDSAHASLVEAVVRRLVRLGWEVATEVTFSHYGERGSIDVLAYHPFLRVLIVIEVKSVVPDMQAMQAALDRKVRLAPAIARERGWDPVAVARMLVLAESSVNRRRVASHEAQLRTTMPARTRAIVRWVTNPTMTPASGIWFLATVLPEDGKRQRRSRIRVRRAPASVAERGRRV
jgi:transcriptional regulator with XRE-family HTH domain